MNLYVITRKTAGYGELQTSGVWASDENAARLAVIRYNAGLPGVDDFANPKYSTAVLVSDDVEGVVIQAFAAS